MKLSTRSRYGLRLMFELARHHGEGPLLLKEIAANQGISEKYLSTLIIPLKGAELVNSVRGAHGGYTLAKLPGDIAVLDIVRIMEGDIRIISCIQDPEDCLRMEICPTQSVWKGLQEKIDAYLKGISLSDIVKEYEKKKADRTQMYYI